MTKVALVSVDFAEQLGPEGLLEEVQRQLGIFGFAEQPPGFKDCGVVTWRQTPYRMVLLEDVVIDNGGPTHV